MTDPTERTKALMTEFISLKDILEIFFRALAMIYTAADIAKMFAAALFKTPVFPTEAVSKPILFVIKVAAVARAPTSTVMANTL